MTEQEWQELARRLLAWEQAMGGWEAPVWDDLRRALEPNQAEPMTKSVHLTEDQCVALGEVIHAAAGTPDLPLFAKTVDTLGELQRLFPEKLYPELR